MKHPIIHLASLALLSAAPVLGQASGFHSGEIIYISQAIPGVSPTGAGIVRIDPATGATAVVMPLTGASSRRDAAAFDAYRERVLFFGQLPGPMEPERLYELDGFGNATSLGFDDEDIYAFAPASGGRFYLLNALTSQIEYLDANNQHHVLMDIAGTQPFLGGGVDIWSMVYDAATNSLFAGISGVSMFGCGTSGNSRVVRIPLSNDGSKVRAALECVEIVIDPTVGSAPTMLVHGPNGNLIVGVYIQTASTLPNLVLVDPVTLALTPYAFPDIGNGSINGGIWSRTLEKAVIVDLFGNSLHSYIPGETGVGTVITPSMPISGSGSAEGICVVEISRGEGTVVQPYCEAKITSEGCPPFMLASGVAQASASSGFLIEADQVPAQTPGLFFYGFGGPAAIPFLGGRKCMRGAVRRTPVTMSTGSGLCGGTLFIDFNAYMATGVNPNLVPGRTVWGQFWFRDPAHPVGGIGLSNGITFTVLP